MESVATRLSSSTASDVADELIRCRRRGLGRLDAVLGSEPPVELPILELVSEQHGSSAGPGKSDRGLAVGTLIRDGIAAIAPGRPEDARLLTELFFGDAPSNIPLQGPGELREAVLRKRRGMSDAGLRREQRQVFLRLGRILLDLVVPLDSTALPPVMSHRDAERSGHAGVEEALDESDEIVVQLRQAAKGYTVRDVMEMITRFDTPDILG